MSDIDFAVRCSRRVEQHLRADYGAAGRGLHSLIGFVEQQLTEQEVRDLRFIASVRNTVVHEEATISDDKRDQMQIIADRFVAKPGPLASGSRTPRGNRVPWIAAAVVAVLAIWVMLALV